MKDTHHIPDDVDQQVQQTMADYHEAIAMLNLSLCTLATILVSLVAVILFV